MDFTSQAPVAGSLWGLIMKAEDRTNAWTLHPGEGWGRGRLSWIFSAPLLLSPPCLWSPPAWGLRPLCTPGCESQPVLRLPLMS